MAVGVQTSDAVRDTTMLSSNDPNFWSSMAVANFDMGQEIVCDTAAGWKKIVSEDKWWGQFMDVLAPKEEMHAFANELPPAPKPQEADKLANTETANDADAVSEPPRRLLLPFPADFSLQVEDSQISVCHELCQPHSAQVSGIALFLPGCSGGVGPARQPGMDYDAEALFPTVAKKLTGAMRATVDCYRLSWEEDCENTEAAVQSVQAVVKHAIAKACRYVSADKPHEFRLFFVGHSFGGEVAVEAALDTVNRLGSLLPRNRRRTQAVTISGICTLNTSAPGRLLTGTSETLMEGLRSLSTSRALTIAGDADTIVRPDVSLLLHLALASADKEHLLLPGATHDLYQQKEMLVQKVCRFVTDGL